MKKLISLVMALVLAFSFSASAFAKSGKKTYTTVSDTIKFVIYDGKKTAPPVSVTKAKLTQDGTEKTVYVVGLLGTESNKGQVNNIDNCFLAFLCLDNSYTQLVKQVIKENIKKDSSLIIVGHSLGGMVAQQVVCDKEIKENYNIIGTVTAGSPYIITFSKPEGTVNRLADLGDFIPKLSLATILRPITQFATPIYANGGYLLDPDGAHNKSYLDENVWGEYDVLGNKDGGAKLTFYSSDTVLFGAAE